MKQDTLLYFHRRNDDNTIFYVGIGGKRRPSDTTNRNRYWHNIVEKVGYSVEIIHTNLTWEQACILEIKYIKQFGRFDLGLGKLVNMTDGGDGVKGKDCNGEKNGFFNKNHKTETKKLISIWNKENKEYKPMSVDAKIDLSDKIKEQYKNGRKSPWQDKKRPDEDRRSISLTKSSLSILDVKNIQQLFFIEGLRKCDIYKKYNISRSFLDVLLNDDIWKNL
jgi:hypothetical protein